MILIDGYNLLFAQEDMQALLHSGRKLAEVREGLLRRLAEQLGPDGAQTVVVFDAIRQPAGLRRHVRAFGLEVFFANRDEGADSQIEDMIRAAPDPRRLTVVSNDRRVQGAARSRGARVLPIEAFMAATQRGTLHAPSPEPEPPEKRRGPSPAESARWVEEFKDLADDRQFRDLLGTPGIDPDEFVP